ncbi:hypothetical protein [Caenispirillum bisanense]|uniref:Uncharacterized protein n=1 Tax=Caenispirillum bisanense TaxID=414052 RepID=A0A286GXJ2_9PROT|nr:hypothetical protein [Caenispirillum bisanense]SOD99896.1 hypothetical protein SAMN05421508_11080 [Caenispirillum bisanense]
MTHRLLPAVATAALLAATSAVPAAAADVGDWSPLDSGVGIDDDVGIDRGAPIADVTDAPQTSTTIDVDVGETPEFEVGVDEDDDIPEVGDRTDVDPYVAAGEPGRQEALAGDVDPAPGEDIIDAPDVDEVPELGVTDREKDPIVDDVDVLPDRRGFAN